MHRITSYAGRLILALVPFALFGIIYGLLGLYPNYLVNEIDIHDLYTHELAWFGMADSGTRVIPGAYFMHHHWPVADLFAGILYLCWVPVPMAFAIWLFVRRRYEWCARMSWAFLTVNLIGFAIYYIHPAAPPWYVLQHGFEPILHTPGSAAGLARFDELTGGNFFHSFYDRNCNVFAALPSLHAAYPLVALIYSLCSRSPRWLSAVLAFVSVGIWFTAVYSAHHYVIDVLAGILTTFAGIALFELITRKTRWGHNTFTHYTHWIS
ncbi:MAG: phosphatase PAP2 family protein [Bacteroidales bacterium]|nr:phosphatase PAP2 family protein [Bacteroidales bacterium]